MGGLLDVRWAHNGIVMTGPYCTAQGVIQQIGELGVALITLVCPFLVISFVLRAADSTVPRLIDSRRSHICGGSVASGIGSSRLFSLPGCSRNHFYRALGWHWLWHS